MLAREQMVMRAVVFISFTKPDSIFLLVRLGQAFAIIILSTKEVRFTIGIVLQCLYTYVYTCRPSYLLFIRLS